MKVFTKKQLETLSVLIGESSDLQTATANNRHNAFISLGGIYLKVSPDSMDKFKEAMTAKLKVRFGKENADTKGFQQAPQVIKDWCTRFSQALALGIKVADLVGLSEGQLKAAIKTEQAVNSGISRDEIREKIGGGGTLKETLTAIKEIEAENLDPNKLVQDKKLKELENAIRNTLKELNGHDSIMAFMDSLITQTQSKPEILIPLAA